MNTVQIGKTKRFLPSRWDELSRDQLVITATLFLKGLHLTDFKAHLLFAYLKITKKQFFSMGSDDVHFLAQTLDFILEKVDIVKNPVKKIKIGKGPFSNTLYGPDDAMSNCTFAEFIKVQNAVELYGMDKQESALDQITAVLYRPRRPFWFVIKRFVATTDPRRKLLDRTIAGREAQCSKISHATKFAVFLVVTGILSSLPDKFPNIYRKKKASATQNTGWAGVVISLADGKTDNKSIEAIMESNMYNVLLGLEQKSIEYFDFISKYPEQ